MELRWSTWLFLLLVAASLIYAVGPIEKQTVLTCKFQPRPGPAPLRLGSNSSGLGGVQVQGRLTGNGRNGLYHYDGFGGPTAGSKNLQVPVSGAIFLAADGSVDALSMWFEFPNGGQLTIATLNSDGILDKNSSSAFLFVDKNERLLRPASYTCRTDRNYDHVYQRLASFNWLALLAFLAIIWGVVFLARRNADRFEFGRR